MPTVKITDDTFSAEVINAQKPVLLDFWAEWCGPCKRMSPALEELADELGDSVTVGKMNIEDSPETPSKFHIRGVPTMMIFNGGEVIATRVGPMSKTKLSEWVAEHT